MANPNKLPVLEVFGPTLQGEGAMCGVQTTFIRAVHCDYACAMCDSMHAVDPAQYKGKERMYTAQELFDELMKIQGHCQWVTISGGNPALWDFSEFVRLCHDADISVAVETQGSVFKPWLTEVEQLTVSPKGPGMNPVGSDSLGDLTKFLKNLSVSDLISVAIKVPVFGSEDLDFVVAVKEAVGGLQGSWNVPIYLSLGNPHLPGNNKFSLTEQRDLLLEYLGMTVDMVLSRPELADVIVLPQLHVLLWGNKQLV